MARLLTKQIATMTEMREPHKVLARAGGKPVAIMKNSRCVGYFVPEESTLQEEPIPVTMDELQKYLEKSREKVQPILDYLRDK